MLTFIFSRLCSGGELFDKIAEEQYFSETDAAKIIKQILSSVNYCHQRKIVHRDLKPENLLIGSDGHLRITDFGFAKKIIDRSYTLCGTPEYLAPEIIMG